MTIRRATTGEDIDAARALFRAYAEALDFDLCFQGFEEELAGLPGAYAPPGGELLLAEVEGEAVGCVAFRTLSEKEGVCEMKRLYVRPAHRGAGVGRALAEAVVEAAQQQGFREMRLDTVASMTAARRLYRALGFRERAPYYANPLAEVVYMERALT